MSLHERIIAEIPHLRRFARSLARDANAADDLVQDCLERALGSFPLLRKPASLRAWLFRILYNLHLDAVAAAARGPRWIDDTDIESELVEPPGQEQQLAARSALTCLQRLPAHQRAAIALVAVEDLGYAEAAAVLGIPVGTLMSRLHRGRVRLRALMDGTPQARVRRVK